MARKYAVTLVLTLSACLACAQTTQTAEVPSKYPIIASTLQPTSATVGQQLKYSINVVAPELTRVLVKAPFAEGQPTSWTLIGKPVVKDEQVGSGKESRRTIDYTIASFEVGTIPAPHVEVSYQPPGGSDPVVRTVPGPDVQIHSVLPNDATQASMRDIKPPVALPYPRWLFTLVGCIAGAILGLICWLIYRAMHKRVGALLRPQIALDEWAFAEIAKTESDRLIEQKKLKELYTRLTDTLRRYLGKLHSFPAWDMTTGELFFQLEDMIDEQPARHIPAFREAVTLSRALFEEADLVKFAKYLPEQSKSRQAIDRAREIVNLTRYKLEPEPEPAAPQSNQNGAGTPPPPPPSPPALPISSRVAPNSAYHSTLHSQPGSVTSEGRAD